MHNKQIINILEFLYKQYQQDSKLIFKTRALKKALDNIKKYDKNIESGNYAIKQINGIAAGIGRRIDEIIKTGTLVELKNTNNNIKETSAVNTLLTVTGIGPSKAKKLVEDGITTIKQLKDKIKSDDIKVTHHIKLGIQYYDDLTHKIPRAEITQMKKLIQKTVLSINKDIIFDICGSYRRGLKESGDIDVLVSNPKYINNIEKAKFLEKMVKQLKESGFIIDSLTSEGAKKYMGICRLQTSPYGRRIDIRCVNYSAFYTALVYFTGSKNFNLLMRKKALELGYSLNEYSLTNKKDKKIIILNSEEELFDILEMNYVKPSDRDL
jgi:DNA polymerase beta